MFASTETAPAPRTDPAPGTAVRGGTNHLRFTTPAGAGEIVLDPAAPGPLLVPLAGHGASLAAALVEALDRAAVDRGRTIEVRRGEATLVLERGLDWPAPRRAPSEVLASGSGAQHGVHRTPELEDLERSIGPEGVATVRGFAARRRGLAADRRRLERRFWALDEQLRARARNSVVFVGAAGVGFAVAALGAATELGGLAASGAMVAMLAAAGFAVEALGRAPLRQRRVRIRRGLALVVHQEESLDDEAARLARAAGADDGWDLADRLARIDSFVDPPDALRAELDQLRETGRRVARALGLPPALVDGEGPWTAVRNTTTSGWPPDVALREDGGAADAVPGLARLLDRVERELPAPWPIVLWEPWPGAPAEERAQRLAALCALAPGRPIVAIVRA